MLVIWSRDHICVVFKCLLKFKSQELIAVDSRIYGPLGLVTVRPQASGSGVKAGPRCEDSASSVNIC